MSIAAAGALLLALALSWWGTGRVRQFAMARAFLDVPSERSSHTTPTPRGGGLAIAVVVLAAVLGAVLAGWVRWEVAVALVPSGAAMAFLGWLDDRRSLRAGVRLLVHFIAASWVVYWFGPVRALNIGTASMDLGWFATPLSILGVVWLVNLFNFMDGIDGLAAAEALIVGIAASLLSWHRGHLEVAWLAALIAVASAGFLPWNWMPARIFMGDAGSIFLGFMLGALALLADSRGALPATAWIVLLGAFVADATFTLTRRVLRHEHLAEAHRTHAYQRAVQSGWSHGRVSAAVMILNVAFAALVWGTLAHPAWALAAYGLAIGLAVAAYVAVGVRAARVGRTRTL
jgi:glycosyltransferase WbpL